MAPTKRLCLEYQWCSLHGSSLSLINTISQQSKSIRKRITLLTRCEPGGLILRGTVAGSIGRIGRSMGVVFGRVENGGEAVFMQRRSLKWS